MSNLIGRFFTINAGEAGSSCLKWTVRGFTFIHLHLADAFIQSHLQCIQAIHFFISMCFSWESNPQPFALLTQCSTTESQEHFNKLHKKCIEPTKCWFCWYSVISWPCSNWAHLWNAHLCQPSVRLSHDPPPHTHSHTLTHIHTHTHTHTRTHTHTLTCTSCSCVSYSLLQPSQWQLVSYTTSASCLQSSKSSFRSTALPRWSWGGTAALQLKRSLADRFVSGPLC